MDLQTKTFRIQGEAGERALNDFLAGKIVRHWATSYSPSSDPPPSNTDAGRGIVLFAKKMRMTDPRSNRRHEQTTPPLRRTQDGRAPRALDRNQERPVREK